MSLVILMASRHLNRMRSHRAEWRRSFCAALSRICRALAFAPFVVLCWFGGNQ